MKRLILLLFLLPLLSKADDRAALQALLNSGNVTLPASHTYTVSGSLNVLHNFNLNGSSIALTGTGSELILSSGVTVQGGTLTGSSSNTSSNQTAIQVNVTGCTITGMVISTFGQYAVSATNASGLSITNCTISNIGYLGISDITNSSANTGINISNNTIDRSSQPAPTVPQPAIIVRNFAPGTQSGTTVSNNLITMPINPSIKAAEGIEIRSCINTQIYNNSFTGGSIGVSIISASNGSQIYGNSYTKQNNESIEIGDCLNVKATGETITNSAIGVLFDGGSLNTLDTLSNTTMSGLSGVPIQFYSQFVHGITINNVIASTNTYAILVQLGAYGITINSSSFTGNNTTYAIKFDSSPGQMAINNSTFTNFTPKLVVGTATVATVLNNINGLNVLPNTSFLGAVAVSPVTLGANVTFTTGNAPTISYPSSSYTFTQYVAISTLTPTTTGSPTSFSISPTIPAGLSFSTSTGVIQGTPIVPQGATGYVVSAHNAYGIGNFNLSLTVNANGGGGGVIRIPNFNIILK